MTRLFGLLIVILVTLNSSAQNRRTTTNTQVNTKSAPVENKKTTTVAKEEELEKTVSPSNSYKGTSFFTPPSESMKMSTTIEFGGYPSDADITVINIYGHLGLNFDLGRRFHIGPYFRHKILSTHEYQELSYEGIKYDVSSLKEWGTGFSLGAYFPLGRTLLINPELRTGYNEFSVQSSTFTDTTNNFIYRNFINFTPRLNLGLKLSEYAVLNFSGGYIFPFYLGKSDPIPHYNPNTFMYGMGIRFYLTK